MKRLLSVILLGSGVLTLGLPANAQYGNRDPYNAPRNNPYAGNREGFGRNQQFVVDRVMADLNRAAGARLDGHERKHFDDVARNLQEFQLRASRGKFDTGKLDKAIGSLEHLANADRIRGRDRDMLVRDLNDLRQFRASRGGFQPNPNYAPSWR